jgi:hypothetical protein
MNRVERFIYDLTKRHPGLKLLLRDIYQTFFDIIPVPSHRSAYPITVREGYYFGFHDHTPFSFDNRMLLANHYSIGLRMPQENDELQIGFFYGENFETWQAIGSTLAWNWHQGCKLQWRGPYPELVYNDFVKGRFIARTHNIETDCVEDIPYPISSISSDGRWAVGYSFERVEKYMPGYGYIQQGGEPQLDKKQPERSGLYLIDLQSGIKRDLLSIADVATYQPEAGSEDMWHYISHALFCPSGQRIAFLHRWVPSDPRARRSRMFTCDLEGNNWHLFPTREMVSHLGWRNNEEIAGYCRLLDGRDRYVLFVDQQPDKVDILGEEVFSSDGHPCFSPEGRWMLTDTYPDRTRRSYLVLFDITTGKRYNLAYLRSPRSFVSKLYRHWSCDLHPRFDRTGRYLCFDAAYTGKRALCTIDLGENALAQPPKSLSTWT